MRRVESVEIHNIKGIESASFPVGSLTILRGDNGTGKTSILDAVASVFEGGHDPGLLRHGADVGEVVIVLTDGIRIRKQVTAKASNLDITTADGSRVPKPATFVEKLAAGFAFDPLAFLEAPAKKRAEFLLEVMPISFQPEEVVKACGRRPASALDVEAFAAFRAGIYEERRRCNVEAEQLGGFIDTAQQSLVGVAKSGEAGAAELRAEKARLTAELDGLQANIRQQLNAAIATLKTEFEAKCAEVREAAATAEREDTMALLAELNTISEDLATAEERERAAIRAEQTRKQIDQYADQFRRKEAASGALSDALAALDELKKKKLGACAIPGIEIRDGQVYVDDVLLDHLNTQRQYFVAFQLAALKAGDLGFMVCDRSESVVGEHWTEFEAAARASGFQVIVARAEAGVALAVEADGQTFGLAPGDGAAKVGRKRK